MKKIFLSLFVCLSLLTSGQNIEYNVNPNTIISSTRVLTINGTAFDLSADRTWTVGDLFSTSSYTNPSWISSLPWSKITGTPTTLSGYGITDAITSASAAATYLPFSYTASPTWSGIVTTNSTISTSTVSGTSWYDGVGSGKNGFNFYSNDASNLGNTFNFGNGTNNLSLYQDHGTNNWLYVPLGSNFVVSVDGGNSQALEIDKTAMSFVVGTSTTGTGTTYLWSAANNTGQTASTEEVYFKYNSKSVQYNAGALVRHRNFYVSQPTIKFVTTSTLTEGTNAYIEGALIAGTNASITTSSGLLIGGLTGVASVGSGVTNCYGIKVHAPTGATNNYAAAFLGKTGINNSSPSSTLDVTGTFSVSGATNLNTTTATSFTASTSATLPSTITVGSSTFTAGNSGTFAAVSDVYFTEQCYVPTSSPANSTTYYFGAAGISQGITTTADQRSMILPYACTLIGWSAMTFPNNAGVSAETSTIQIWQNNTTPTTLTTGAVFNSSSQTTNRYSATGLSTNFAAGDRYELKFITPAWVTPPTNCHWVVVLYFKRQ